MIYDLRFTILGLVAGGLALSAKATTYYVATNGSDANAGTNIAQPFATPQKAVTLSGLIAGDTIYVRGGNYAFNTQVKPNKAGTADNYIKLWAYPGEKPVWDFATLASGKALDVRKDYWHVKGIEVKNAPDNGVLVGGFGNIIEGCVIHDCDNDGLILGSSSFRATNSLILNCDSYRNYGGGDGNNGDGFAGKVGCSTGNIFRGCRAWNNSDDGWDFYDTDAQPVVFQNCWAFNNGYDLWNYGAGWSGNGNGFKLGGEGTPAQHNLTNCVTFGNRRKGFDHNNSDAGLTMVNCTGYSNGTVNFSFPETPTKGARLYHLLINCASYGATLHALAPNTVQISNSWQLVTVTAADFASLDTSVATNARNADYSLPVTSLFRLAAGSQLIDRGADVGLPFNGVRLDLGAYEYGGGGGIVQTPSVFDLAGCGVTNGGYRLKVDGLSGHGAVVLYYSTNLTNWTPLGTNPAVSGSTVFIDGGYGTRGQTLYRVLEM